MLIARYVYGCNSYYDNCNSAWHRWGRWVLAGVVIFVGLVVIAGVLLMQNRRRRRSHPVATSTPMAYQAPIAPAGGYYNSQTAQPYDQNLNPQYEPQQTYNRTYAAPEGPPPPQYNTYELEGGVVQPGNVYQPRNK